MKELISAVVIIAIVFLVVALQGWIVMMLWNLLAGYFGFKTVTFWIACGIALALSVVGGYFKSTTKKGE